MSISAAAALADQVLSKDHPALRRTKCSRFCVRCRSIAIGELPRRTAVEAGPQVLVLAANNRKRKPAGRLFGIGGALPSILKHFAKTQI
jgi:hypothetical protein